MWGQDLFAKPVFLNHDLKIDVDIFATGLIVGLLFLLLSLQVLHLDPPLFPFLLYPFDLVKRVCLCSSFHL